MSGFSLEPVRNIYNRRQEAEEKNRSIFFEKKKQKTFGELDRSAPPQDNAPPIDKVFLLLFVHKKKILPAARPIDFTYHLSGRKVLHERYLYDDGIAEDGA